MKKLKYYIPFIFLALVVILTFPGCKEEPPIVPPPSPPEQKDSIVISIKDVTHRSISLSMQLTVGNRQSKNIKLFREFNSNEYLVAEYPVTVTDTTIIDDDNGAGLLLDTTYSYYAVIIDSTGSVKDTSNTVTARTLAPTTHNYTWTEYTIGEWQSYLTDVWGTDENNVYAVGSLTINGENYSVLHYNGTEWSPVKDTVGGTSVFGFSANDIWVVGGGVYYYDGNSWKRKDAKSINNQLIPLDTVLFNNSPYTSIWGTSSSNLYLGNIYGKIIHWDGLRAEVVAELDDITITDLFGLNSNLIIASLSNLVPPGEAFLFDGMQWNKIPGLNPNLLYKTAYLVSANEYYVAGEELLLNNKGNWTIPYQTDVLLECMRGNQQTGDIVAVGHFSTLFHYNGIDWQRFQFQLAQYTPLLGVYVTKNKIFAVGAFGNQARIIIGTRN